jgi:hypothetical protein
MYLGKLKKQANVIWDWYVNERKLDQSQPSDRVMKSLKWFAKHNIKPEYNYTGDWKSHLKHASDRMNGGRAKAILRLIKESTDG